MRRMIPIGVALVLFGAAAVRAQTAGPGVRDRAGLFSAGAVREADQALREVQQESGWQAVIETVETLGGRSAEERAIVNAEALDINGLYVLIAAKEHRVRVEPGPAARAAFSGSKADAIVAAVTVAFKARQFDKGLRDAVALIRQEARAHPDPGAGRATTRGPTAASDVLDQAGLFSPEAVRKAEASLRDVERDRGWQAVIETVETLGGRTTRDLVIAHAKERGIRGLYVLIAEQEHKVGAEASHSAEAVFNRASRDAIVAAVTDAFKARQFDKGLLDAVAQIQQAASAAPALAAAPKTPERARPGTPSRVRPPAPAVGPPDLKPRQEGGDRPPVQAAPPAGARAPARSGLLILLLLVVGAGLVIWILRGVFRANRAMPGRSVPGAWGGSPAGSAGRPGAPGPGPGYPPAGGYGPPPAAGGGGFLSGALGGLGGAVLGNILYDRFGRPHPHPAESPGGAAPHETHGGAVPPPPAPEPVGGHELPAETYDPNAYSEGDWGGSAPAAPGPDAGGDWGGGDAGSEGDWGGGDAGGDWGGDAGGDWGGDAGGGGSEGGW